MSSDEEGKGCSGGYKGYDVSAQKKLPRGPLHILKRRSQDSKGKGGGLSNLFEPMFL